MRFQYLILMVLAGLGSALLPSARLTPAEHIHIVEEAPAPEEILLLEELDAWSGQDPVADPRVPFPEHPRLSDAVQQRRESFEVFTSTDQNHHSIVSELPFGREIVAVGERHEVDPLLIAAVVEAESSFDPQAVSAVGAVGLMQLMPDTALELGASDFTNPSINLDAGTRYLRRLLEQFDGNLALALAAYNAGPGNVQKFGEIPPFRETRQYVEKVLGRYLEHRQIAWQQSAEEAAVVDDRDSVGTAAAL